MSSSSLTIQRTAEVIMFGALCLATADIVWSRLDTGHLPPPPAPALTAAAGAVAAPATSIQQVLDSPEPVAPPVPPAPPAPPAGWSRPAAPAPAVPAARVAVAPAEPLPVLAGTLVGNGVYLGVLQSQAGTRVVRQGDRFGSYIVNWVGPYKACVKDSLGQKHVLALGVGSSSLTASAPVTPTYQGHVSFAPAPASAPVALPPGRGFQAPPPPPPPPPAPVR